MKIPKTAFYWGVLFTVPTFIAIVLCQPDDPITQQKMLENKYKEATLKARQNNAGISAFLKNVDTNENQKTLDDLFKAGRSKW